MTVLACTYGQREVDSVEGKRFEQIIVTVEAGIAEVTLNRPDRYNALGSRMVGELGGRSKRSRVPRRSGP
jgi:1,4-dihydroxy-2-naphthoyl-CoA synthase